MLIQPAIPVQTPKPFNIPPRCQSRQLRRSSLFDVTLLLLLFNGSGARFQKKVTNCLHVATQLLAYYVALLIATVEDDILTFALNQACSGKGLLIRHPFKTPPTSYLCYV